MELVCFGRPPVSDCDDNLIANLERSLVAARLAKRVVILYDVDADDVETFAWEGTFGEFAKANQDSYDADELADIADALTVKGEKWLAGFVGCLSVVRIAEVRA